MVDVSCSHDVDVVSHIVAVMVLLDHVSADGLHIPDVSKDGKPDLLFLEDASVGDLDGGF